MAAARAAYLAGFASTSNLEAARRYGVPTAGTAAHAFTLLHDDERAAFAAQVDALGTGHDAARRHLRHHPRHRARGRGGRARSSARSASTPATSACWPGTPATSSTGSAPPAPGSSSAATWTSSRSPRWRPHRSTRTAPVRRVVTGSRRADRRAWSTSWSRSTGGRWPSARSTRAATAAARPRCAPTSRPGRRSRRSCSPARAASPARVSGRCSVRSCAPASASRTCRRSPSRASTCAPRTVTLPWDGLKLSRGEPAIPTRIG